MSDNENTAAEAERNEPVKEKDAKPAKKDAKPGLFERIQDWFGDIKGEFKKVVWPSGKELFKQTFTVIVTSAIIGLIIVGFDYVFGLAHNLLMKLS